MQGKSNRFRSCNTQRRNIRKDIPIVQGQQCTHSPKSAMECCGFLLNQSARKRGWEVEDNWTMIDSLMSEEERKFFGNHGVVGFIVEDIKNQIRKESEEKQYENY